MKDTSGNVLIGCDWNQIEMRAVAHLSRDPVLMRVYSEGRELHLETAARIAGVPGRESDQGSADRRQGRQLRLVRLGFCNLTPYLVLT